jgi:hypothetical protein
MGHRKTLSQQCWRDIEEQFIGQTGREKLSRKPWACLKMEFIDLTQGELSQQVFKIQPGTSAHRIHYRRWWLRPDMQKLDPSGEKPLTCGARGYHLWCKASSDPGMR